MWEKIKTFIIKYILPITEKAMIAHLEKQGFCVCKDAKCKRTKKGA